MYTMTTMTCLYCMNFSKFTLFYYLAWAILARGLNCMEEGMIWSVTTPILIRRKYIRARLSSSCSSAVHLSSDMDLCISYIV